MKNGGGRYGDDNINCTNEVHVDTGYCSIIKEISTGVKLWIGRQNSVLEESITDWLLDQLSYRIPFIHYKSFTRNEEAKFTGADWEWFIVLDDGGIKFRVQAKKLRFNVDNYPAIAYSNNYGMQIDKLIDAALMDNAIPIYAFYTSTSGDTLCRIRVNDEGVYTADAYGIRDRVINVQRVYVSSDNIMYLSLPLSCMFCCSLFTDQSNVENYSRFLNTYFSAFKNSENTSQNTRGIYNALPGYIESFVKYSTEKLPEWWEKEFQHKLRNIAGLLVTDLRNDQIRHWRK
ncbi:MAG: DUF6615 family protein [Candidatus Izemoplasmatales bacterium]|nr:DUF6615 family protein [Candidatus Izemoplasmatales bacterium]